MGSSRRKALLGALLATLSAPAPAQAQPGLPHIHAYGDLAYDSDLWLPLTTRAADLPRSGRPLKRPWNAYWWPYKHGGLTRRWLSPLEPSPIEKLDQVSGHPQQGTRWETAAHPGNVEWGGQCDGFSIASVLEPEPRYPVLEQGVCFAAGDVKGLLGALYMGDMTGQRVDVLGRNLQDDRLQDADLDPATFHLALTNVMGLHGDGLYLDVGADGAIYNKPIAGYTSRQVRRGRTLEVTTTVEVVKYLLQPEVEAVAERLVTGPLRLTYELELDEAGAVIPGAGRWTGRSARLHPTSLKIPRGSPTVTRSRNPYLDPARVRALASRSATGDGPECWPEAAPDPRE